VREVLTIAVLSFSLCAAACAVEVEMSVDRDAGCGGPPKNNEWKRIEHQWLEGRRLELKAWDVETGGCTIDPESVRAVLDGTIVRVSSQRDCPAWGEPTPMCANAVRVVYVLDSLPSGTFTVVIAGGNPGFVDVDG
jgi:hypothetical protein